MKGSDLKRKLKESAIDLFYKLNIKKSYKTGDKILITSTDGIGDFIVREKVFLEIVEKYGKENVIVLVKDKTVSIVEKYGIKNIIVYDKESRKKFCAGVNFLKKILPLGISTIYSLEFSKHDLWFIKYFSKLKTMKKIEIIGYTISSNSGLDKEYDKYYTKLVSKEETKKIVELSIKYLQEIFNKKISLEDIRPDLSNLYNKNTEYENSIAVGVGSIDRKRIMSPKKMCEILKELSKSYPESKIILLGKGNLEKKVMEEMVDLLQIENIVDKVNKISLEETNTIINSSKLYIGMESGLYNIAFGFKKKIIGLFAQKENPFGHDCYNDVIILSGLNGEKEYFGNEYLNGINPQQVIEASKELLGE